MAGISSMYADGQSVNFSNPASYSANKIVTYDIGVVLDKRTLKSIDPVAKYGSVNLAPAYVALGMPLSKKNNLGIAFGLRPLTRINYSIIEAKRAGGDSVFYQYNGEGGLYQGFVGIGKAWLTKKGGGLRVGVNTGYMFGNKKLATLTIPLDTVNTYKSRSSTQANYNSLFISGGAQVIANLSNTTSLNFGLAGNMKQKLSANKSVLRETYTYDGSGAISPIDTVSIVADQPGKIQMPSTYSVGVSINNSIINNLGYKIERSSFAIEYESSKWSDYRFYGEPDKLINSWQLRFGGQITPNPLSLKSYWNTVAYRAGFYMGKEAVNADGNELPIYGITLGAGFRVRKWRSYDNQYTNINASVDIGKRGNNNNNINESFVRASLSLNLSDLWFIKRKYD